MSNPSVVAVHMVIMYEAVCHSCGWWDGIFDRVTDADRAAGDHEEWCARRDSNPRPSHP